MQGKKNDSALAATPSPRIILVGGSNLSFGINSQILLDSLKLPPINTGIHAGLGLVYMLDNVQPFIKSGDVVVVIPEYDQYLGDFAYGSEELIRTVLDVKSQSILSLRRKQLLSIVQFIPKYTFSKLRPTDYFFSPDPYYSVTSFNKYGDVVSHYTYPNEYVELHRLHGPLNPEIIDYLKDFENQAVHKRASVYVSYPCFIKTSFDSSYATIKNIEKRLKEQQFKLVGTPERYSIPDSLFFNTYYHLNKSGAELRTRLLIEDLSVLLRSEK